MRCVEIRRRWPEEGGSDEEDRGGRLGIGERAVAMVMMLVANIVMGEERKGVGGIELGRRVMMAS